MLGATLSTGYIKKRVSAWDEPVMSGWQMYPWGSQCRWGSLPEV